MSAEAAAQVRPTPTADPAEPRRRPLPVLAAVLAALLCALALPLVPQLQNVTTVQWPAPGAAVESTMLTLTPYRPLELHATVPCSPAPPAPRRPLFATAPLRGPGAGIGLEVRVAAGRARVTNAGQTLWAGPVPARDCLLRVDAVGDVTRIRVGEEQVARVTVDPPRVAALATALPSGAPGLSARLVADSRFETSPTLLKKALIALAALAAVVCLALLARLDPVRPRSRIRPRPQVQDLVLLLVLGTWALIGPMLADDGFNVAVADGFADTGTLGNRYRWYNAPEAPFALVQQALVPLLELGRSPWLLRLPSVGAAVVTWLLLSRFLLPRLPGSRRAAQWLGLLAFLAWWMPYDLGLRPEPWIALASTAVLVLVLRAADTGRLLPLAAGGVLAALALAYAPSGLLAAAPYLALAPRLLPLLRERGLPRPLVATAVVTPGAVTLMIAVFADTGLAALAEATRIHSVIGPTFRWWEEAERYRLLFSESDFGVFARRLPVLLLVGALVLLLATRRRSRTPDVLSVAALCAALSLGALVLAPSKWSHHFGGLAGYGALVLAGVMLQAPDRLRREGALAPAAGAAVGAAALAAAGFAGPNLWVTYSSLGIAPRLPGVLQSPLLWLAAGAAVAAAAVELARPRPVPRSAAPAVASATVAVALAGSVAVMLASFVHAANRTGGGWSMAGQSLGDLRGSHCGMADHVLVLRPAPLKDAGLSGERQAPPGTFRPGGSHLPPPGNLPVPVPRWGTLRPPAGLNAEAARGRLTSGWYEIPARGPDAELGLAVSGRTSGGNRVALQYARRSDPDRILLEQVVREQQGPGVDWRYVTFGVTGPAADLVRVVADDATTGRNGWVATSAPLLMQPSLLRDVLAPGRVSIDFPLSFAFPCADQVTVAHGLADLPTFGIAPRPDLPSAQTETLEHSEPLGGTLAMARRSAFLTVLPTRYRGLLPQDALLERGWGTLVRYDYPYPAGLFAVSVRQELRSSLDWGYRFPVPVEPDPLEPFDPLDPLDAFDKG